MPYARAMRHIILGAGAVGGTLGGLLFHHGHSVVLVARGAHLNALRARGLTLRTPEQPLSLPIPSVGGPEELELKPDDALVLATKTQDSLAMLDAWADRPVTGGGTAGERLPVFCAQNGVENERLALRKFATVCGVCVWLPATHLSPGEVSAYGTPVAGMLHIGRYPRGADAVCENIARHFAASRLLTYVTDDVMRWKWSKLAKNLANVVEALCGATGEIEPLAARVEAEGAAVLAAAEVARVSDDEERRVRGDRVEIAAIDGAPRGGGSSWQSLQRGAGTIESDYLNGEIVLMGRLHGVPTRLNATLQRLAARAVRERWKPGRLSLAELAAHLDAASNGRAAAP
jgi:2-dehydropantoate 2-reductase